ncbi:MAG: zinc ribbon domain-containing protein [Clostridia bacterium]|nr:zinc ribbon domain-containing protein [Clostridia bacterium]
MTCNDCGAENEEGALFCKNCGERLDGKVKCPRCGAYTAKGKFCNFCGKTLPGTARCEYCGSVIYGDFVKRPRNASQKPADTMGDVAIGAGEETFTPRVAKAFKMEHAEEDFPEKADSTFQKLTGAAAAIFGILAVVSVFVFMFFTGMSYTATKSGEVMGTSSEYSYILYYFFGKAYDTVSATSLTGVSFWGAKTVATLGTVISSAMMVSVTVLSAVSLSKIIKSLRQNAKCETTGYILATFFVYVAFCLMLQSLMTRYTEVDDVVTEVTLNKVTYAGIICGAVFAGCALAAKCVLSGKDIYKRCGLASLIVSAVGIAFLIASAALLSGRTTKIFVGEEDTYRLGYIAASVVSVSPTRDGMDYATTAQIFTEAYILLACMACAGWISGIAKTREKHAGTRLCAIAALAFAVIVMIFGILEVADSVNDWNAYTEGTFIPLIVGVTIFAVSFVLMFVSMRLERGCDVEAAAKSYLNDEESLETEDIF